MDSNLEEQLLKQFPYGHPDFARMTLEELALHSSKNHDYARGGNPLGNFYRTSAIRRLYPTLDWGSPIGGCLDYLLKQFDAALWMLNSDYEGEVEDVDSRLRDVHVYAKLARLLHRETHIHPPR